MILTNRRTKQQDGRNVLVFRSTAEQSFSEMMSRRKKYSFVQAKSFSQMMKTQEVRIWFRKQEALQAGAYQHIHGSKAVEAP